MTTSDPDGDAARMTAAAAAIGLAVPPACVAGVLQNLRLLAGHAALLGGFDLDGLPLPPATR